VTAYVAGNIGALVEINSETDFVAKNDEFMAMANLAAKLVAEQNPADVAALGALSTDGKSFDDVRTALIGKIGENMTVRRFQRFETTGKLASYLHGNRIGVIVDFDGADEQVGKDVAMHIAAMKPVSLSSDQVPAELIEKERSVAQLKAKEDADKAVAEGKTPQSEEIVAKRIDGSVQKYLKEVSLFNQAFVKNDKQSVEQMLKASNATVKAFTMYVVGEGIEKKVDDFAAEVAAQMAAAKQ
jgi:elongation factor Ts